MEEEFVNGIRIVGPGCTAIGRCGLVVRDFLGCAGYRA
jgi:hypothetical protein